MVPTEGPKLTPVSNDINSLTVADTRCLGRFWWPVWWPAFFDATARWPSCLEWVPWWADETPGGLA